MHEELNQCEHNCRHDSDGTWVLEAGSWIAYSVVQPKSSQRSQPQNGALKDVPTCLPTWCGLNKIFWWTDKQLVHVSHMDAVGGGTRILLSGLCSAKYPPVSILCFVSDVANLVVKCTWQRFQLTVHLGLCQASGDLRSRYNSWLVQPLKLCNRNSNQWLLVTRFNCPPPLSQHEVIMSVTINK